MYAIIEDGGKQYKVGEGESVRLEKKELEKGATVEFDRVLLVSREQDIRIGTPVVAGAKVIGIVQSAGLGVKLRVVRFKRRRGYTKRKGHRQPYTLVRIEKIECPAAQ